MILHPPEISRERGEATLSAIVEFQQPVPDVPERLWFKVPEEYASALSEGGEAFAASLLLVAMYWGEDMQVRAPVSPRFAYGLEEYKRIFHLWFPGEFRQIEVKYGALQAPSALPEDAGVLVAYSGGVDSTFTLWSTLAARQVPETHCPTHAFFLQGIDYGLEESEAYQSALRRYTRLFECLGLPLLGVRANAMLFSRLRLDQGISHGGPTLAVGLALGRKFKRYLLASGYPYMKLVPAGSSPLIDHWLSTETLEIVHYGAAYRRIDKLRHIAHWQVAQEHLRVCSNRPKLMDGLNCSRCSKCRQNMIRLEMMGLLPKFSTFVRPFRRRDFLPWSANTTLPWHTLGEIVEQAVEARRWDFALGVLLVWFGSFLRRVAYGLARRLVSREAHYRLKLRYYGGREPAARSG